MAAMDHGADAAVLGEAAFGDIHVGHDFESGDAGGLHLVRRVHGFKEDAVDAVADDKAFFVGFYMDVAGALFDAVED